MFVTLSVPYLVASNIKVKTVSAVVRNLRIDREWLWDYAVKFVR